MTNATYLGWSLLLAGLAVALVEIIRRKVRSTAPDLTRPSVRALIVLAIALFFGLIVTNLVARAVFGMTPPAWSELVSWFWIPIWGLSMIVAPAGDRYRTAQRVVGIGLIVIGLLTFLLEFHKFSAKA